jgi:hypothetical protein
MRITPGTMIAVVDGQAPLHDPAAQQVAADEAGEQVDDEVRQRAIGAERQHEQRRQQAKDGTDHGYDLRCAARRGNGQRLVEGWPAEPRRREAAK